MKDLGKRPYSQNGQSALPTEVTDSLYPPNRAPGFARTHYPDQARSRGYVAQLVTRMTTTTFYSSPVVSLMMGANPGRSYVAIQNNGSVDIYVGFGSIPDLAGNNALTIQPNSGITFENGIVPNNDVYVVSSIECQISIIEGVQT